MMRLFFYENENFWLRGAERLQISPRSSQYVLRSFHLEKSQYTRARNTTINFDSMECLKRQHNTIRNKVFWLKVFINKNTFQIASFAAENDWELQYILRADSNIRTTPNIVWIKFPLWINISSSIFISFHFIRTSSKFREIFWASWGNEIENFDWAGIAQFKLTLNASPFPWRHTWSFNINAAQREKNVNNFSCVERK